jgi:hypothetical protein
MAIRAAWTLRGYSLLEKEGPLPLAELTIEIERFIPPERAVHQYRRRLRNHRRSWPPIRPKPELPVERMVASGRQSVAEESVRRARRDGKMVVYHYKGERWVALPNQEPRKVSGAAA